VIRASTTERAPLVPAERARRLGAGTSGPDARAGRLATLGLDGIE
jgi:hypothetical protein